jgi:transketolase
MRATFIRTLVEIAEEDERIVLLTGDLGFTVVEPFAERFPERFFNVGVAEQNMLGVATGLAEAGFVPFAYSIATFATLRSYEFVRNGPVMHHLPVRVVGVGGGLEYGMNGLTHYALEDIALMRVQPGMTVLAPADFQQARTALIGTRDVSGPIYFRLGKNETETVPGLDGRLRLDGVEQIGAGRDVAVVTTGSIAHQAAAAVDLLEAQGWCSRLVVAACLSPSPAGALAAALRDVSLVVTVEAHYLSGGLGSIVSEVVAESGLGCRVVRCGVARLPNVVGSEAFLNEAHGLSAASIARTAATVLAGRDTSENPVVAR